MSYTVIFEGVRCFHSRHSVRLKPVTLLTGENSSGKTTFLALTRIAWDVASGEPNTDFFNERPFALGSYDQIASYRGGRGGRAQEFTVGIRFPLGVEEARRGFLGPDVEVRSTYREHEAQPKLAQWTFECGQLTVVARSSDSGDDMQFEVVTPSRKRAFPEHMPASILSRGTMLRLIGRGWFGSAEEMGRRTKKTDRLIGPPEDGALSILATHFDLLARRPYAFAPIRSQPRRTFDPRKEVPEPEGSHVPFLLARTIGGKSGSQGLGAALQRFGQASGLYTAVEIKRKGRKQDDPFQIGIKVGGPSFNLVDVGYGVSQVLPIIVDTLEQPRGSTFLLQQPEVHLHPRAQAELGTFLAAMAKDQGKSFVVETHSDYLIDRVRMEVRDGGLLTKDDVSILYFERGKEGVTIHDLELDEYGNILNAPSSYREFFLQEDRRMLGMLENVPYR